MRGALQRNVAYILAILSALAGLPRSATAQSPGEVVTTTRVNLRPTADSAHTPLRILRKGAHLQLLEPDTTTGFYHVVTLSPTNPDTGWIAAPYVRLMSSPGTTTTAARAAATPTPTPTIEGVDAPASAVSAQWDKQSIVHSTWRGTASGSSFSCAFAGTAGNDDPETNERKNRADVPSVYHAVQFDAIADSATMPWPKGKIRPTWDKTPKGRADRARFVTPFEGAAITITGFIRVIRQQKNNHESTNCGKTGEANTDWHIALVGAFAAPETLAMVVEPTPRSKKAHNGTWTKARLATYENPQNPTDSVRISGFLMLDPEHMNHMHKFRQTLWEIHPVTRIEVFVRGEGWKDLDDLP
jgi:hypothetical protein